MFIYTFCKVICTHVQYAPIVLKSITWRHIGGVIHTARLPVFYFIFSFLKNYPVPSRMFDDVWSHARVIWVKYQGLRREMKTFYGLWFQFTSNLIRTNFRCTYMLLSNDFKRGQIHVIHFKIPLFREWYVKTLQVICKNREI